MLTQTSEVAIRALIFLALRNSAEPLTPREIAESLMTSPTYMAKITRQLVKANILRSQRGAAGGVTLARDPERITLLAIMEASQGLLVGNYCDDMSDHAEPVCAFHRAMKEAHHALVSVLTRWTLADLMARPGPAGDGLGCKMGFTTDRLNAILGPIRRPGDAAPLTDPTPASAAPSRRNGAGSKSR
jgi:Rrf2 family nitric oxide-sensitive transcriptional repressor